MPSLKNINKIILTTLLSITPLLADDSKYKYDSSSLVGLELGYNNLDVNNDTTTIRDTYKFSSAGLKIGAQTQNYRIFLSARYLQIDDFNFAYTLGGELQYLINFSEYANLYLGVNAGQAEMEFVDSSGVTRFISDPYLGGDIGMNIHLNDTVDLEFGARMMTLNAENDKKNVIYTFNSITSGYMSLIFKYQID